MNFHRIADGVAAVAILFLLVMEYGLDVSFVSSAVMALGDAGLHVLIFGTIAWHVVNERLNGKKASEGHLHEFMSRMPYGGGKK